MPQAERATLVITAVGSGVGHTLLQSLQGRRERLRIVGLNSEAEVPELFQCDAAWLVPRSADARFGPRLDEVLAAERPALVIPGRDEDLPVLAALAAARPALAPRLLVGSVAAAQVMVNKLHSAAFAQARGLPFTPTVGTGLPQSAARARELLQRFGFPLIAKPAEGNGSRGVRVLLDEAQLARAVERPGLVLQPMLDAPPPQALQPDLSEGVPFFWGVPEPRLYAVRGWIDREGRPRVGCSYRMTMANGRFEHMSRVDEPALTALADAYGHAFSALGWRGPYHLQLKADATGTFWPIEFSGRLGGGTAGRRLLGHDELGELLRHWLGPQVLPEEPPAEAASVVARAHDFAVPRQALDRLRAAGHWRAGAPA